MDVSERLLSVSRMVKRGYRVVFDSEQNGGSYAQHMASDKWYRLHERNGVYVLASWVRPFDGQAQP